MTTITDNHGPRLHRMIAARVAPALGADLQHSAERIAEFAAENIKDGAISGAGHVPSKPGEPPNADTHVLDESIHAGDIAEVGDTISTSVGVGAEYGLYLELGTSKMAERPFLRPAVAQNLPDTIRSLSETYRREVGIV